MNQILRLCQQRSVFQAKRFLRVRVVKGKSQKLTENNKENDFKKILLENKEKITFSSYLDQDKLQMGYFKYYLRTIKEAKIKEAKEFEAKSLPPMPVVLRYCVQEDRLLDEKHAPAAPAPQQPPSVFQLPFAITTRVQLIQEEASENIQSRKDTSDTKKQKDTESQTEITGNIQKEKPSDSEQSADNLQKPIPTDAQHNYSKTPDLQQKKSIALKSELHKATTPDSKQKKPIDCEKTSIAIDSEQKPPVTPVTEQKNTPGSQKHSSATDPSASEVYSEFDHSDLQKWMRNYEYFDDTKLMEVEEDDEEGWSNRYGTPDPTVGISNVPCGGCGALLHCNDPAIPGYLPSEIYKGRTDRELKRMECQRCHFLKEYNIALDVTVQPEEYEKLLQAIRHVKSLVVLMVDLLDFPCSIWPGVVDVIGTERPIIIVGNKVDLIPGDSRGYLKRIELSLLNEISATKLADANIKHVALVSAKTGYGVEELISAMFKHWLYKGDVFLVGCTNVGKSSLFNALLQSDYCKVHAVDIIKRATVSRWPGTTLNLLKFPINRPSGWKIYQRTRRLKSDSQLLKMEKEIRKEQLQGKAAIEAPALIGHIGRTFSEHRDEDDAFLDTDKPMSVEKKDKHFAQSKWFYDTPGVVHPDQVLSLLSTEELLVTVPKQLIRPQTYYLQKGYSIFVGGLARLDHVDCSEAVRFTVFCSDGLPITVTKTEDADDVYRKFLGTELLAVPTGGSERLENWPGLKRKDQLLEFEGQGPKVCCGDVVLSSVAWVGVTAKKGSTVLVAAWTPEGRGVHKRAVSLLPYAVNLKGKRLRDTPAYSVGKVFSDEQ